MLDMHHKEVQCSELTTKTAEALDNKTLQQLFISTQKNNLNLCIEYDIQYVSNIMRKVL